MSRRKSKQALTAPAVESKLDVSPGPRAGTVRLPDGEVATPPESWALLPPGDSTVTRRVKAAGPSWTVKERHRRRMISKGVWAPKATIESVQADVEAMRKTERYAKEREASLKRRENAQADYVEEFRRAVLDFLAFPPRHVGIAVALAEAVSAHATPVGSGTVARTSRIPVERRAEAAVIAWMRHATTAYDNMSIPRVKGRRREVRRMLAEQSRRLLAGYRKGEDVDAESCPLQKALSAP